MRPPVKVVGRYPLAPGEVVVDSLVEIERADITYGRLVACVVREHQAE